MQIVWFSWKDINHPDSGGAEVVSDNIRKNLAKQGHNVSLITSSYNNSKHDEIINGVRTIRSGGRYTVYLRARKIYKSIFSKNNVDLIIDEMNTVPFMASFYTGHAKKILLTYQLARSVWFYQMYFPLSYLGYIVEPFYLKVLSKQYPLTLTESESTKNDLVKHGFNEDQVKVFNIGMALKNLHSLSEVKNSKQILFLGALRPMKRPIDAIKAFEFAHNIDTSLKLVVAGSTNSKYSKKVLNYISKSRSAKSINLLGKVSESKKYELLKESFLILVTSTKEGWGLIVTEANSQGTPAVVYDTDGLRDSVVDKKTGIIVQASNSRDMGETIIELLNNIEFYESIRRNAYENSKIYTFENSYASFIKAASIK